MRITVLVENKSTCELTPRPGLALYIETKKHKILFDVGPDGTLFKNSKKRGIDLTAIDTVIISHGHSDHTGALKQFLEINHTAKIYIQKKALERHYLKLLFLKINVGIPSSLHHNPRFVLLDGDYTVDDELHLFTADDTKKCYSDANNVLYTEKQKDDFAHEHNLLLSENTNALFMGCGHAGIVNILEKAASCKPSVCVGGYHLWNPVTKKNVSQKLLEEIVQELSAYNIRYYTCHCTGEKAYRYLSDRLPDMRYLSCGETIEL